MSVWNTACDLLKSVHDDEDEVEKAEGYKKTGDPSQVPTLQRTVGKLLGAAVSPPKPPTSGVGGKRGQAMEAVRGQSGGGPFRAVADKPPARRPR